jgi:hypothetical protein
LDIPVSSFAAPIVPTSADLLAVLGGFLELISVSLLAGFGARP